MCYCTREGQRIPVGYLKPMRYFRGFYEGIRLDTGADFHAHRDRLVKPGEPCRVLT